MNNHKKISLFTLMVMFLIIGITGCSEPNANKNITVKIATAENQELKTSLSLSGVLLPNQTADISRPAYWQVKSVGPDVGDPVKTGDVLVVLDAEKLNAQLMQAEAGLKSAEASAQGVQSQMELAKINLDAIQKNFNRTKALYDSGTASQSQMDDVTDKLDTARKQYKNAAGPALAQAQAAIETARANIQNLKVQIAEAIIRSPFDGIVTNRNADPGEVVSPGVSVISVADTSILKMKSSITQDLLPLLTVGQEVDVTIDIYPDRVFKGTVSGIGPIAVNTGGVFPVEIAIQNDGSILSGLSAHATLNVTGKNGVVVPTAAVLESGEKSYVFVIQNGVAIKRVVTTGLRNDQGVEILKGVMAGELVAVTNIRSLSDNLPVNIQ
jgi:HlyD family secretion protein